MKGNILDKALNFKLNNQHFTDEEREIIRQQILMECYKILLDSKAVFIDKLDDLNKLGEDMD